MLSQKTYHVWPGKILHVPPTAQPVLSIQKGWSQKERFWEHSDALVYIYIYIYFALEVAGSFKRTSF